MSDFTLAICSTVGLFLLTCWLLRRPARPDSTDGSNMD